MAIISEISYLRDALVNAIRFYYHFLVSMYMDESMIDEPPENGWETIPNGWINFEKTDEVIDLLRRLPYLSYESAYWPECPGVVKHTGTLLEDDPFDWEEDGLIPEVQMKWRESSAFWAINDVFEMLKLHFETLEVVPAGRRKVEGMYPWIMRSMEDQAMLAAIQKIYKYHGWPDKTRFRKEDCIADIEAMISAQFPDADMDFYWIYFFVSEINVESAAMWLRLGPSHLAKENGPTFLLDTQFGVIYWYKCLDEVRFMDDQAEGDGYGWADDGRIPEDQAEWKYESGVWPIKVFFEILKRNFEQLNFAPIGSRIVKAMWGSGSNQTREILFAVQKIYRDHAWPDRARYSKEDCLEDIKIMLKAQFPDVER
ncbi:hypothetical protein L13192_10333 [Pyrenophora tritici-repentis]|nr:hypothetical protein L13192_10333 [Pyrenophora tritici-repentis]